VIITVIAIAVVGIFAIGVVVWILVSRPASHTVFVSAPSQQGFVPIPQSRMQGFPGSPVLPSPAGPRFGPGNAAFQGQQDAMNRMNQQMEQQRQLANQMNQQNMQRMQQMQNQAQQNMQSMRDQTQQSLQNRAQQMQEHNEENLQGDSSQQSLQRVRGIMRPGPGYGGLGF
jgi:flagellar biosynthesis GTPase FlhF